jgi:uncharacterized membrane protein
VTSPRHTEAPGPFPTIVLDGWRVCLTAGPRSSIMAAMRTNRLEAFSDGVLAIIITIMVLELKPPEGDSLAALGHSSTALLSYLLSFVYIGIYWNNHHHLFQIVHKIDGSVLWANLALLFSLSLLPFTTSWMDDSTFADVPVQVYGVNLLLCGFCYFALTKLLYRVEGPASALKAAMGTDVKGVASLVLYVAGLLLTHVSAWLGIAVYTVVAIMWLVPDRRIERYLSAHPEVAG